MLVLHQYSNSPYCSKLFIEARSVALLEGTLPGSVLLAFLSSHGSTQKGAQGFFTVSPTVRTDISFVRWQTLFMFFRELEQAREEESATALS